LERKKIKVAMEGEEIKEAVGEGRRFSGSGRERRWLREPVVGQKYRVNRRWKKGEGEREGEDVNSVPSEARPPCWYQNDQYHNSTG
jgi:hypothetical protein